MVVLFLQPKDFVLHLFALLILSLWAVEWALGGYRPQVDLSSFTAIRIWLGTNPRNWALVGAVGFGTAVVISTVVSPLPAVSLWGRDFVHLGYELYSVLSLLVIFFAISLRTGSADQVRRILWVVAGAGAVTGLYGISQRFGWDPIGDGENESRVLSSFGNPIFFGSYLVMSTVITLGLALDEARKNDRWWLPVIALLVGIQLTAMWFTGSRGPWVGLVSGFIAFGALGALSLDRTQLVKAGSVLVSGLLLAAVLVNVAGDSDDGTGRGLGSIVSGVSPAAGGLGARADIWEGSFRLLDSWETQQSESAFQSSLRPLFGLGPEMFFYSYPLVANPQSGVIVPSHAHSLPLQLIYSYGFVGLATFVVLTVSTLIVGISVIRQRRAGLTGGGDWLAIVMLAVMASLIGRSVEQAVGVARVGDLVPFWALLGVALAVYGMSRDTNTAVRPLRSGALHFFPVAGVSILAIVALGVFFVRDIQPLRAGLKSADAFEAAAAGNSSEAQRLMQRASELAPDVEQYRVWTGELLVEEAGLQVQSTAALQSLGEAYEAFIAYEERDPYSFATQLRINLAETEFVNRGNNFFSEDLIERAVRISNSLPSYPTIQAVAAERVLIAGQIELGRSLAERAIAMESAARPQPFAWFMRGNALAELGDLDGALESFTTALEREPEGQLAPGIHSNVALVYESIGNTTLAEEHRALAAEIEAALIAESGN